MRPSTIAQPATARAGPAPESPRLYLRLSVTPACNFRCAYCRPAVDRCASAQPAPLDDAMLVALVSRLHAVAPLRKIRITGGEPLLRAQLPQLVAALRGALPAAELCLTTNGSRLAPLAGPLAAGGIVAVNVSVDSAVPATFAALTGGGCLDQVIAGVEAARAAGLRVKLNAVLQRTGNGGQLPELVRLAARCGCTIRLIELMPLGPAALIFGREHLPASAALARLREALPYHGCRGTRGIAEEHLFSVDGRDVTVGLIAPVSRSFCHGCDRVRLDAAGRLHACLRREDGADLAALLGGGDRPAFAAAAAGVVATKREAGTSWPARSMAAIGG